ncbi:Hypothetical protein POVR1_LOCUS208 [uncultured virus]|nr:Hypothetical protein POVR1_LOCUS208 [uncultured virus]
MSHHCRLYVNAITTNPIQNGNSWCTAYKSLQAALDRATTNQTPTDIWVAEGIYYPSKLYSPIGPVAPVGPDLPIPGGASGNTSLNLRTFDLPDNVSIFGGFKGCEKNLCERDFKKHRTILSGGNVYWHVITAGNDITRTGITATLDGIVIKLGCAQGPNAGSTLFPTFAYAHNYGGGIYSVFGSNLTLRHCGIFNNKALSTPDGAMTGIGGGIFSASSNLTIIGSYLKGNFSNGQAGALASYFLYESVPHFTKIIASVFDQNNTVDFGGAIVFEGTNPFRSSEGRVVNCEFTHNYALEGGAVVVDSVQAFFKKCIFRKNHSSVNGGALATTNVVNALAGSIVGFPATRYKTTIKCCEFHCNQTDGNADLRTAFLGGTNPGVDFPLGGGALTCYLNGILEVYNSKFVDNDAVNSNGGAILNGNSAANLNENTVQVYDAVTRVFKSEFIGNSAVKGGAIASFTTTTVLNPPIAIPQTATFLSVDDSLFKENTAIEAGGAIYFENSTAEICDNNYQCNQAPIGRDVYGVSSTVNDRPVALYIDPIC